MKPKSKSQNGKGDFPRPLSVSRSQYEKNYDEIFKHNQQKVKTTNEPRRSNAGASRSNKG